jgi:hypothetical protein
MSESTTTPLVSGIKFDLGKAEYGLIPPHALDELAVVLTLGAQKYKRENWRFVADAERRYFDALQRHVWAWKRGEVYDSETGRHHLAHAMCCLVFLYEHTTGNATKGFTSSSE